MNHIVDEHDELAENIPLQGLGLDKFASLFRWLGTLAVVLSAAAYMLEGFDAASSDLRHWVCLGMMSTVALAGLFSQLIMKDSKTARLLFSIAIGLISVQFSHLGGILFDTYGGTAGAFVFMATDTALTPQYIVTISAVSLAASLAVAYIGFQILARQQASRLMVLYILTNTTLLLPDRASLAGVTIVSALILAAILQFHFLFRRHSLYKTREGIAVQLLFLVAPAIALTRLSFYFGDLAGYCAIGGILAAVLVKSAGSWITRRPIKEGVLLCAAVLAVSCWHELATEVFRLPIPDLYYSVRFAPVVALLLLISQLSPGMGRPYRMLSMMVLALLSYVLCLEQSSYASSALALLTSLLVLAWGLHNRYREPALGGGIMTLFSLLMMSMQVLANINSEIWMVLSVVGFALVMMATLIERYGRNVLSAVPRSWKTLSRWQ
ncbi:MAG: hypothetical protein V7677_15775 [Motiliproteus sp.]